MSVAIKIENLSKQYRLGMVGTGTISHDLNRWWAKLRGKEDPYAKVGQVNKRDQAANSEYVWALKDINLQVEEGEVLGIIGANGAGKSTLLKIISRITSPTTGTIKAKGRIASLLEVGTGMNEEMTARENVYLNGSILGMRRHEIARKFDDIIDFAGCRMFVDTPVKRYSSGMRVRLGFAVAAFLEPEILIVDEVLAVGDSEFQNRAVEKMKSISSEEGRTILFVSHNMNAVSSLCSGVCIVQAGTLGRKGNADDRITEYLRNQDRTDYSTVNEHGIAIRSFSITSGGQETSSIPCGADIQFHIELLNEYRLEGLECGIVVNDYRGSRVLVLNTYFDADTIVPAKNSILLSCAVPSFHLVPADYSIDLSIARPGHGSLAMCKSIATLSVTFRDILGSGLLPTKQQGVVVFNAAWSLPLD